MPCYQNFPGDTPEITSLYFLLYLNEKNIVFVFSRCISHSAPNLTHTYTPSPPKKKNGGPLTSPPFFGDPAAW